MQSSTIAKPARPIVVSVYGRGYQDGGDDHYEMKADVADTEPAEVSDSSFGP